MPFRDRFLTFRLLQKHSAGSPRRGISFQSKTQLLQTALCDMNLVSSSRTFMIDRPNTTILNLSCFVSLQSGFDPMWNLSLLGRTCKGIYLAPRKSIRFRPQIRRDQNLPPCGKLAYIS